MSPIFFEITIVVVIASVMAIIFRYFRQPSILAYILTGLIVGPIGQLQFEGKEVLHVMGEIGVTILLFMVGLDLRLRELRTIGKVALFTGVAQILFTSLVGYLICIGLGFSNIASLYISVALTFSSTIIIVKLLSDKKDLNSLYGKISVGFLLVQDFFAVLVLIFLSGFNTTGGLSLSPFSFLLVVFKGIVLFGVVLYLSRYIIPRFVDAIAHSSETLFLFSVAWALGVASLVSSSLVGFSIEIGGFLAGLALANSSESFYIVAKIKSLRDFFITIFFVVLGMSMDISSASLIFIPAVILSIFVLIGNPIIVMIIMGIMGYRKRTSFLAGLTVAQISEFSLIIIFLGNKLGHISKEVASLVTVIGIITFTGSTYMILHGNYLYGILHRYLSIFEKKKILEEIGDIKELENHVVLVGANRTGSSILEALLDEKEDVVVVDFNPDVTGELVKRDIPTLFGDIADIDIQEKAQLHKAKLIISTIADLKDNLSLISDQKKRKNGGKIIVVAVDPKDAKVLYKAGADYVIIPRVLGGRHLASLIKENNLDKINKLKVADKDFKF